MRWLIKSYIKMISLETLKLEDKTSYRLIEILFKKNIILMKK